MAKKFFKITVLRDKWLEVSSATILENYEKQLNEQVNKEERKVSERRIGKRASGTAKSKVNTAAKVKTLKIKAERVKAVFNHKNYFKTANKRLLKNVTTSTGAVVDRHRNFYNSLINRLRELGGPEDQIQEIVNKIVQKDIELGFRQLYLWAGIILFGIDDYVYSSNSVAPDAAGVPAFAEIYNSVMSA